MSAWKFTDATRRVVSRLLEDGRCESCLVDSLAEAERAGVLEPDPPAPPTAVEVDETAALQYQKLRALAGMTQPEIDAWVAANVTNLAGAQDAIKTLAKAVSVLLRREFAGRL